MKKLLIAFIIVSAGSSAYAKQVFGDFSCSANSDIVSESMEVTRLDIKASIHTTTRSHYYKLVVHEFHFSLDDGEYYLFSGQSIGDVNHNPFYVPRVYKNHIQFKPTLVDPTGSLDQFNAVFDGEIAILLPETAYTELKTGDQFTAYAIATNIGDHWGSTIGLDCRMDEKTTY